MGKRLFDAVLAFVLLTMLFPLLAAIALAIRLDSRGPAIFRQVRVGRDRREFVIWKFRTMAVGSGTTLDLVVRRDPRVTRSGRYLRSTHLDELPQLWNIIRGDMSFVGPRPITPAIVRYYEMAYPDAVPQISQRFRLRPGLTGLSQMLRDRPGSWSDDLWMERLRLDIQYHDRRSFLLDIAILCRTIPRVMKAHGV